jgi:hypothetical protein
VPERLGRKARLAPAGRRSVQQPAPSDGHFRIHRPKQQSALNAVVLSGLVLSEHVGAAGEKRRIHAEARV